MQRGHTCAHEQGCTGREDSELQATEMRLEPMQAEEGICRLIFTGWMVGSRTRHQKTPEFSPTSHVSLCASATHSQTILPDLGSHLPILVPAPTGKKSREGFQLAHLRSHVYIPGSITVSQRSRVARTGPKIGNCHTENHCELKSHPSLEGEPSNSMLWTI